MATNNKYDRQLRLWGSNGQKALSESCVVLINATSAGTESLKNLVLPGIGSFHIVDDQSIPSTKTPFHNFFVFSDSSSEEEGVLSSRAEVATKYLSELNPDVRGEYTTLQSLQDTVRSKEGIRTLLDSIRRKHDVEWNNMLVICADLSPMPLRLIADYCWNGSEGHHLPISLVLVKSYGLLGTVRVQVPDHPIIESKPENVVEDLRLGLQYDSFPELHDLAKETRLEDMDSMEHGHVPYVIILLKALDQWRKDSTSSDSHCLPKNIEEKKQFKEVIRNMARNYSMEMNFQEAFDNAYLAYSKLELQWETQQFMDNIESLMEKRKLQSVTTSGNKSYLNKVTVASFDVLLFALKRFMAISPDGQPPLNGSIPDMTSSTQSFIKVQNIYQKKAEKDRLTMRQFVNDITNEYSSPQLLMPQISDEYLSTFTKNIYSLRHVRTRSYCDEYDFSYSTNEKEDILGEVISATFDPYEVPDQTPLLWYIALRACETFYEKHNHYPGKDSRKLALESDANEVQGYIEGLVEKLGFLNDGGENALIQATLLSTEEGKKGAYAREVTRYYNAELHNVASVVGGVASQEAVKLITGQYIPMDGTYVFNGIACVGGIYKF